MRESGENQKRWLKRCAPKRCKRCGKGESALCKAPKWESRALFFWNEGIILSRKGGFRSGLFRFRERKEWFLHQYIALRQTVLSAISAMRFCTEWPVCSAAGVV